MVVHTPSKLDVLRQTAAERRAANGDGTVPPSVAAAAASGTVDTATAAAPAPVGAVGDLMGGDFAQWTDTVQPSIEVDAEVHENEQDREQINSNVTTRRRGVTVSDGLTADSHGAADEDKISIAGSVSDVTPPPPPPPASGQFSQLNPFTPEWFAQLVGTAASAAASAAVQAMSSKQPSRPSPVSSSAPRRLNERKIPDFWEDRPEFWFRIFDAHLAHFDPSEQQSFDALLPLLTPAARATVHTVIRAPGGSPYSKARESLLRHFGRTPRQLAREAREARSLGDKLPSEFLDHLMALLPDIKTFYEVALLDALPSNARVAALQHTGVRDMAQAADAVVLESRAELESSRASVSALSLLDDAVDGDRAMPAPLTPSPVVAAMGRDRPAPRKDLCSAHARWGKKTYKCQAPSSCRMSKIIAPRPSAASSSSSQAAAPGNGRAGGQ